MENVSQGSSLVFHVELAALFWAVSTSLPSYNSLWLPIPRVNSDSAQFQLWGSLHQVTMARHSQRVG